MDERRGRPRSGAEMIRVAQRPRAAETPPPPWDAQPRRLDALAGGRLQDRVWGGAAALGCSAAAALTLSLEAGFQTACGDRPRQLALRLAAMEPRLEAKCARATASEACLSDRFCFAGMLRLRLLAYLGNGALVMQETSSPGSQA